MNVSCRLARGVEVFVTDPQGESDEAMHDDFARKLVKGGAFIDVKAAFDPRALAAAGLRVWRL